MFYTRMPGSKDEKDDIVPKWNGDLATYEDYKAAAKWHKKGTNKDDRGLLAYRMAECFIGAAAGAAKNEPEERMDKGAGVDYFVEYLYGQIVGDKDRNVYNLRVYVRSTLFGLTEVLLHVHVRTHFP